MSHLASHLRVKSLTATPPTRDRVASQRKGRRRQTFWVECLEERCLLSGVPNWISEGPAPVNNAQLKAAPNNAASGAVESIAVDPDNSSEIVIGTVNGGVWKTTNANPASPGSITWTPLTDNMPSLAIGSVGFDPLDTTGNTIFAGTGTFSNGFDGPPPAGVLRTTDGGTNWTILDSAAFANERIKTVLPTAINAGTAAVPQEVVLAATVGNAYANWIPIGAGGLYESIDNGTDFTRISGNGLPAGYGSVTSLVVDPNNPSQFFAAIPGSGIFRGDSNGNGTITWTEEDTNVTGIAGASAITLAAHGPGGTVLYAAVANGANISGVFTSSNSGGSWTALATPPAPNHNFAGAGAGYNAKIELVADPVANNIVYMSGVGTNNIFRYNPSGAGSWVLITGSGAPGEHRAHADSRNLEFLGDTVLLESDDGGFYFLKNPTDATHNSWQSFNGNLGETETYKVAYDPNDNLILAGTQDNGTNVQTGTGSTVSNQFSGGDGGFVQYDATNNIAYALSDDYGFFYRNNTQPLTSANNVQLKLASSTTPAVNFSGLNSTKNTGGSGTDAAFATNGTFNIVPFVLNSTDPTQMLIGREGLYTSSGPNTGDIISQITPTGMGFANALIYGGFRAGAAEDNVIIVGDLYGQLFFRGETGTTFTQVAGPGTGRIIALAVDPQDWRRVYVVQGTTGDQTFGSCQVFMTNNITDLTNNPFTNITYNLAGLSGGQLRAITLFDDTPTTAGDSIPVVGGLGGVYRLLGTQWTRYGQGLPNTVVEDVQYEPSNDLLIAGTFGRGVWEVQNVSTSIASTLAPSPAQPVVNTVEASLFPIPVLAPPLFNNGKVASYTDANLASTIADFTATIDWGDGTPMTAGTISQPAGAGTAYIVSGSHTYADSGVNIGAGHRIGTFAIQVFVVDDDGSRLTVDNTANVADNPITLTGLLNPESDSGLSSGTPDVTNVTQPDFYGTSEPFSQVTLLATALPGGTPFQIGQVQAGGNGPWNIKSVVALADGHYEITATGIDQFGVTHTAAPR